MTRYRYNQQVSPPAPFVYVDLRHPIAGDVLSDLPAQIDTGSDFTVVPLKHLESLQVVQLDEISVRAFGGATTTVPSFVVEMTIRGFDSVRTQVVGSAEEPWVLLGRDVLNLHHILLDGPKLFFEIE